MKTSSDSSSRVPVVVRKPMNDHGTMTVEVAETNETRHLVDYATSRLQSTLSALPEGTTVPVEMVRVGVRSNVWQAVELGARRSGTPTDPDATAEPARLS